MNNDRNEIVNDLRLREAAEAMSKLYSEKGSAGYKALIKVVSTPANGSGSRNFDL